MPAESKRKRAVQVLAILFIVGAFVYAGFRLRQVSRGSEGSSTKDEVTLVCGKCQQEFLVSSREFAKLPVDETTAKLKCPKCGAPEAEVASLRCPKCTRAIARQPFGSAFVCPYCKASLAPEGTPAEGG